MLHNLEDGIVKLYAMADQAVEKFKAQTGMHCPAGCVACCNSPKVEATIAEMIPLAFHLFTTNQAELLLKRLELPDLPDHCILFRPDLVKDFGGGCSHYRFRALVCRLFGFAGRRDKYGEMRLSRCNHMNLPAAGYHGELPLAAMPVYQEFGLIVTTLHPSLGARRIPINEALRQALAMVGLHLDLAAPTSQRHPSSTPFDRPTHPRRRAA